MAAALLAATVAGAQQRANTRQAEHDRSASDPGPENRPLLKQNPSSNTPPPTDEWAIMLNGNARVSVLNPDGTVFLDDVAKGDLWYFPAVGAVPYAAQFNRIGNPLERLRVSG